MILSYTVGDCPVLEMPSLERAGETTAFTRVLNLGPSATDQTVQLIFDAAKQTQVVRLTDLQSAAATTPVNATLALLQPPLRPSSSAKSSAAAPENDLLGLWEFNEGGGEVAQDRSGHQRPLKLEGTGWDSSGQEGSALSFAGHHFAEVARPDEIDFDRSDLSIAVWIKTRKDGTILSKTAPDTKWVPDGKSLFVRNGRLGFDIGWVGAVQGEHPIADGAWHHVMLTWSHTDGHVALFVDGRAERAGNLKPKHVTSGYVVRLGFTATNFPASPWLHGSLDGLRLYGRILSAEEIATLAQQQLIPQLLAVGVVGAPTGSAWVTNANGHIRLRIPAHNSATNLKLLIWGGAQESLAGFARLVQQSPSAASLEPLTHGGPAHWNPQLTTHGKLGADDGPYAIDTLTCPEQNPWDSWMRFGGVDFFADGKRAALGTWSGDVWIVSGINGALEKLTWQRIATGLFQPLGLQIVKGQIYVLGRDQITILRDLNGDGETDFYQNFNNDCLVSEHFHEFALDLKTDQDGNFYYIKCARHALPALHPHHGTLLKLPPDGSKLEVVARGFRAVNGLGVGPNGELTCVDNQGYWMPANRINWIKPGGWYGNQWAWNPENRTNYDEPLCWVHNFVDRSGGTHLWVPTDQWGPLQDQLITLSYGMGRMFLVLKEEVDGLMQGGLTRFPMEFDTGVMRGVFHPQDHQLYACGLYGWAGNKTKPGEFYRIRYTGKPLNMPQHLHVASDGMLVGFSDPLDPTTATDSGNYDVKVWNYHWTANYGSPDFKPNGQEGRETLPVKSATLSADRKTVFLELPGIQPVMQMHIVFNLKAVDGSPIQNFVHNTIHHLGHKPGLEMLGTGALASTTGAQITLAHEAQGLIQTITRLDEPAQSDIRHARLAALYVPDGAPLTPFLDAGRCRVLWSGYLKMDLNDHRVFEPEGVGTLRLRINDQPVLDVPEGKLDGHATAPVALRSGLNRFEMTYLSPRGRDAEVRLAWSSPGVRREPIPSTAFVHDPTQPAWREAQLKREGRLILASRLCLKCHTDGSLTMVTSEPANAMPELSMDAPALDGVGDRLKEAWLSEWLRNPRAFRTDSFMPKMLHGSPVEITKDARDLAAFLASLQNAPPTAKTPVADITSPTSFGAGKKLFADLGCVACHLLPGDQPVDNDPRQSLAHVKAKWRLPALMAFLRNPTQYYRWNRMPDFQLTETEATVLTAYILSRTESEPTADADLAPADAEHGRQLAINSGCLNCHTLKGVQSELPVPTLVELQPGNWRQGCLSVDASVQSKAPDFGFTTEQRSALIQFAQTGIPAALRRTVPSEFTAREYRQLRCNACHSRDAESDLWSSLKPENALALETVAANPFDSDDEAEAPSTGSVHVGRPNLSFAGEKLYADWMKRFFTGVLPYKPRSTLQGRMPAFPAYGTMLAYGLAHQHGYSTTTPPLPSFDPALAAAGQRLTLVNGGFSCISCHDVGSQKALAGKDTATINFVHIAERLRPSYYRRYIRDPQHLIPGTMMPTFIGEDGTTPIKSILDGNPERQFTALWNYLLSLRQETTN